IGQMPHSIPGIQIAGGLDISSYIGDDDKLRSEWATDEGHIPIPVTPHPVEPPKVGITFHDITMTEFGGPNDPQNSAYGGKVNGFRLGVALPYKFLGKRPEVLLKANNQSVKSPIVDVGPYFT